MGWFIEEKGLEAHEGSVVAVVRKSAPADWQYRELGVGDESQWVQTIQVVCSCGWASPRMAAPLRAEWHPNSVELHDQVLADRLGDYWAQEHVRRQPRIGPLSPGEVRGDVLYGAYQLLQSEHRLADA